SRAVVAATACALLVSAPAQSNLRFGQVSVFIVLLALVDALGLTPTRLRGVLAGVAAAIKLTPLLFVVFFLVARRRDDFLRSVAAFVGCGLVGLAALPSDSVRYWTSAVAATSRIGDLASLGNQSVRGMLLRVGVEQSVLPVLWLAIVATICAVALLRARQLVLAGDHTRAGVLVGCATVAASPVSWTHHQLWTVLAAMLLVAADGALQRIAGAALFVAMTLSLGIVLAPVSTRPGVQFALENARTLGAVAVCCLGFGGVAVAALSVRRRVWWRAAAAGAAGLALVALLPLPAGADPTFKAYSAADVRNPRYFYACASPSACAALVSGSAVGFRIAHERTKVRVNGVVDAAVARMEYRSAPGGAPRLIPLVEWFPGQRGFSFRSATLAHGRLTAYDMAGVLVADLSP
ncbi:MAG TPA: glycosyltransferase 87 family protein, partial [Asanoa sp.]